jgi:hypothetical protein
MPKQEYHEYSVCETKDEICDIVLKCEAKYWCKRVEVGISSTDFDSCPYKRYRNMIKKKDVE